MPKEIILRKRQKMPPDEFIKKYGMVAYGYAHWLRYRIKREKVIELKDVEAETAKFCLDVDQGKAIIALIEAKEWAKVDRSLLLIVSV